MPDIYRNFIIWKVCLSPSISSQLLFHPCKTLQLLRGLNQATFWSWLCVVLFPGKNLIRFLTFSEHFIAIPFILPCCLTLIILLHIMIKPRNRERLIIYKMRNEISLTFIHFLSAILACIIYKFLDWHIPGEWLKKWEYRFYRIHRCN